MSSAPAMATALLLPGNMCDARLWHGGGGVIAATLERHGCAVTDAPRLDQPSVAAMARVALAAVAGPLVPVGFSMGGIVALEMARQAPDRVVALILADTNAGPDLPARAALRPAQQARVRAGELATIVRDELKPNYLAAANRGDAALRDGLRDMALALGPDVFVAQSEALRTRDDAGSVLDAFAGPVLLIAGAEDALCPPAWHAAMAARARRATLRIIPGAGHMTPLETPDAFAAAIDDWLTKEPTWRAS